ncbi:PC-Esterase domain-containing protein/PMR5N domain-containing protein [Cephalotus follicularis]|uniref:PC-Esterase domain-containing protein/PMR5N domain-containing protein n=1 Tax=Cephalotus follicularis TaxID=3775 RepID=A0A1Q3CTP2_CEPFO|nr:PC-Esterase domain-containing protein/PMR5N domain-containing protein [Cephalotus follicularis]
MDHQRSLRQRSLCIKPTRFLVFTLTVSSSVTFLTFFSIWIIRSTTSLHQESHVQFNGSFLHVDHKPITIHTLTGFSKDISASDVKDSILIATQLRRPENTSRTVVISDLKGQERKESGSIVTEEGRDTDAEEDNFTSIQGSAPEPSYEEVQISEKVEEKYIGPSSIENIEAPSEERIEETNSRVASIKEIQVTGNERIEEKRLRNCDVTKGRWVYDESYPLYTHGSCPFIDEGFNCETNGRPDKDYMKWRWQPEDCDIPRFNAKKMLELIRGKRLVFVGDSINRNQWESMLCMLMPAIKDPKRIYETHGRRITKDKGNYSFKFVDYKCTVEYYVSHFLVHEGKARIGQKRKQTLRIDTIDRGSSRWRGADIVIFNTAHWWSHYKTKAGINYYQEGNQVHPKLDVSTAFRRALMTWASWVDKHINQRKAQVFFRSSAPSHFSGGQWNSGGHCMEATQTLTKSLGIVDSEKSIIAEEIVKQMKTRVTMLNITSLSGYRIDGHPSIYGRKVGNQYSSSIQDCSHWCLPGVPDIWNEFLYFHLQCRQANSFE